MEALAGNALFDFAPSHDQEGDLGTTLALRFHDAEKAKAFAEDETLGGYLVVNSGKHVYYNWGPVMEHRGAHCDELNPYKLAKNQGLNMNYTADMLPNTIDYINRTYHITLHCDWTEAEVKEKAAAILKRCSEI